MPLTRAGGGAATLLWAFNGVIAGLIRNLLFMP